MPSSLAAFGMSIFVWVLCSCLVGKIKSELLITLTLFYCPFMVVSRVYLIYHTMIQVITGGLIGAFITTILFCTLKDKMLPHKKNKVKPLEEDDEAGFV